MCTGVSVLRVVVSSLPAIRSPFKPATPLSHSCVSGLERADRQSACGTFLDTLSQNNVVTNTGLFMKGQHGLHTSGIFCSSAQRQSGSLRQYNPRRPAAGGSGGIATAEGGGLFTPHLSRY